VGTPFPTSTGLAGLSPEERSRYARQLVLPQVGPEGQARLKAGRVLVVGAGGLGSPAAMYLAAAGVGTIGLVDFDAVELSNLPRQLLYETADAGRPKLEAAGERLRAINPHVTVLAHDERLDASNARALVRAYDVVADGTDNFPTRYLVNDACVLEKRPNVHASVLRFEGQASVFWAGRGPCYRCLHPAPPPAGAVPDCAEGGVLGVLPGLLGLIQATESIKILLSAGETLVGRLLMVDALSMRFREIGLRRDPGCAVCGEKPTITDVVATGDACAPAAATGPARRGDIVQPMPVGPGGAEITVQELRDARERGEPIVLVDVREPFEWQISDLPDSVKIPLASLPSSLERLAREDDLVVYCRTGGRSGQAVAFLRGRGYPRVRNLVGGINGWADAIDPSMAKY
jgi:adenylyltransferase/sulfurtransferase